MRQVSMLVNASVNASVNAQTFWDNVGYRYWGISGTVSNYKEPRTVLIRNYQDNYNKGKSTYLWKGDSIFSSPIPKGSFSFQPV